MVLLPDSFRSLTLASATSLSKLPYVNLLPDTEGMTTVDCGSWLAIAWNIGNLGNVEAILENFEVTCLVYRKSGSADGLRRMTEQAFLPLNIASGDGEEGEEGEEGALLLLI